MAFDNDHLSRTLDRADRGLDHCPPDEPRERPPLDPRGTVRLGFVAEEERCAHTVVDTIMEVAAELPSRPVNTVCGVCHGRGYHKTAQLDGPASGNIECSKCGGRGVYPAAFTSGEPGNAARNRDQDDSAARLSSASTSPVIDARANGLAPAPTSSHACAVTDEARARAILGLDVAGFYLRNSLAYLRATGDLEAAHVLVDVINATALLKSATESRAALARVHLEVAVDVADELDRRGGADRAINELLDREPVA